VTSFFKCSRIFKMPNLVNKDSTKYELSIKAGATTRQTSINGNTNQNSGVPSGKSTISIKGGASIESDGTKDIVIQNGKMSTK
jgi:hypothetical protein